MAVNSKLEPLHVALRLPQAHLEIVSLPETEIKLYLLNDEASTLELNPESIAYFWQQLPFWAFAWAGGRALAQWIIQNPQTVRGKTVLDFGCGSGVVAIAAAQAGARQVWVADLDPNALLAAQLNAELNQVSLQSCQRHHWPDVDVLLASDVLYDISSQADLRELMHAIPVWYLAEREFVRPKGIPLERITQLCCSTLPQLHDFDENLEIEIYQAKLG